MNARKVNSKRLPVFLCCLHILYTTYLISDCSFSFRNSIELYSAKPQRRKVFTEWFVPVKDHSWLKIKDKICRTIHGFKHVADLRSLNVCSLSNAVSHPESSEHLFHSSCCFLNSNSLCWGREGAVPQVAFTTSLITEGVGVSWCQKKPWSIF